MRIVKLLSVSLLAALLMLPSRAHAQISLSVLFGSRLGPEVGVSAYSPDRLGEWRANYQQWTPVTLYEVNGRYYRHQVRGARPVNVYVYDNEYFLPPRERGPLGRAQLQAW